MSVKKYRPYFTLPELKALRDSVPTIPTLYSYLDKFIRDIEDGFRSANHTLKPSMAEKLGAITPPVDIKSRDVQTLLDIFMVNKSYIGMSPAEISNLQAYRFENDMMHESEEDSYVTSLLMNTTPSSQSSSSSGV
jgi:hypothetical protein